MKNEINLEESFPTKENIEQDIVSLIAKVNILYLIADGLTKEDNRVGMALEEISRQLDQQSRRLLESWELYSGSLPDQVPPPAARPDMPEDRAGNGCL